MEYLSVLRKDPHFGVAAVRATAMTVRGARSANPFELRVRLAWLDASLEQGRTPTRTQETLDRAGLLRDPLAEREARHNGKRPSGGAECKLVAVLTLF